MPGTANERPLTVEDIAELLQKHPYTVRNMLVRGDIPGAKIGNRWYVTRANFDALLAGELR